MKGFTKNIILCLLSLQRSVLS